MVLGTGTAQVLRKYSYPTRVQPTCRVRLGFFGQAQAHVGLWCSVQDLTLVYAYFQYPFESLFRSQQYALLDNACREYLFVIEFFMCSGSAAQDLFNLIMSKTLTMFLKHVEVYVQDCYDSIALFLCIHIIHRFQLLMHERSVPALDRQACF